MAVNLDACILPVLVARNPDERGKILPLERIAYHVDIAADVFVTAISLSVEGKNRLWLSRTTTRGISRSKNEVISF